MSVLFPEATPVLGNLKVAVVDALASMAAPDLSAELNAGTTLDISCFISTWAPSFDTTDGQARPRLCTTVVLPVEGRTQFSPIQIEYVYDPQAATSTNDNKARLKLAQGSEFYIVERSGFPYTQAFAATDYTRALKFRCGRQNRVPSGDDEFAEFVIQQKLYPLTDFVEGQVVA